MAPRNARSSVTVGGTTLNGSDLRGLQAAWRKGELVLCLGAGVSMPYGIPSWRTLVLELLLDQASSVRELQSLAGPERRALAEWLADSQGKDLVVLARAVKRSYRRGLGAEVANAAFVEAVRACLYPPRLAQPKGETSLTAAADLIADGARTGRMTSVLTYNFDDLLEAELRRRGVPHVVVADARRAEGSGVRIIHPHGFVPREGEVQGELVFTEDEYHQVGDRAFHWGLTELVQQLRHRTLLFLGLSMSDPNLRRMLDAAKVPGDRPRHWQLQQRPQVAQARSAELSKRLTGRVRELARELGSPVPRNHLGPEALEAALTWSRRLDREVFEAMGVKTLWLEGFEDIPELLGAIRATPRPAAGRG